MHGGEGVFQIATLLGTAVLVFPRLGDERHITGRLHGFAVIFAIARVAAQPFVFRAPVDVLIRFPDVRAAAGKAEGLEAHGFQGDVAGEYDQVGPGNIAAIFLLDRPEQPARLVQADVVRPTVEGSKALLAGAGAATAVTGAVGAGGVPGHANKQRAIVAEVCRPPVLRVCHQRVQVILDRREVQALEGFGVVETLAHGVGQGRVLVQDPQVQLVRPPVAVRGATAGGMIERAFRFSCHVCATLGRVHAAIRPGSVGKTASEINDSGGGPGRSINGSSWPRGHS